MKIIQSVKIFFYSTNRLHCKTQIYKIEQMGLKCPRFVFIATQFVGVCNDPFLPFKQFRWHFLVLWPIAPAIGKLPLATKRYAKAKHFNCYLMEAFTSTKG